MARPTKLTREIHDRIVAAVRAGSYMEAACKAAGISSSTLYRWLARGEEEQRGAFREFWEAVEQAEAEAEVRAVALVAAAMPSDLRAAVALLERRFPLRWRRHEVRALTGQNGEPLFGDRAGILDLTRLSEDELALFQQLADRATVEASGGGQG